jgi:hypothetical protein
MPRANRHFLMGHVWHITHRRQNKRTYMDASLWFAPGLIRTHDAHSLCAS